jgi:hypothetical protein
VCRDARISAESCASSKLLRSCDDPIFTIFHIFLAPKLVCGWGWDEQEDIRTTSITFFFFELTAVNSPTCNYQNAYNPQIPDDNRVSSIHIFPSARAPLVIISSLANREACW